MSARAKQNYMYPIKLTGKAVTWEELMAKENRNSPNPAVPAARSDDDDEFVCADDHILGQQEIDKIAQTIDDASTLKVLTGANEDIKYLFAFGYLSWNDMTRLDTHLDAKYKHFRDNHPEQSVALNVAWQHERDNKIYDDDDELELYDTKEDAEAHSEHVAWHHPDVDDAADEKQQTDVFFI